MRPQQTRIRWRALALTVLLVTTLAAPSPSVAYTQGTAFDIPFPRVAVWRPDVSQLDGIARYDYTILHPTEGDSIAPLKQRHPDMLVLAKVSACQKALYSEAAPAPENVNDEFIGVPSEWFLTQVGSRLSSAVNSSATNVPVQSVSVFRVGDVVVMDQELAKVTAVNTSSITVRRGLVPRRSAAVAHAAGTRVAALVCVWPGAVEMDLSTYCPRVTVDPGVGPETWAEYNARLSAAQSTAAAWDGLALDRVEGMEARYVGRPLARTIDPTRSNAQVTDGYAAFDAAWEAGLRQYVSLVRSTVPANKIVFGNVARKNLDLLNGACEEGFPRFNPKGLSVTWPWWRYWQDGLNSYLGALKTGAQPNLSSVLTYDDDSEPGGVVATPYDNPADDPAWKPNYRKMRLGLTTALMGDGFFDYEMNTFGLGRLGLFWFDEYDNVGTRRGYLGAPLADARLALPALSSADLVKGDGAFSTATQRGKWYSWWNAGYAAKQSFENGTAKIAVTAAAGQPNSVNFCHDAVSVKSGTMYTISFRARADRAMNIAVRISQPKSPYAGYIYLDSVGIGTDWQTYELTVTSRGTDAAARLAFGLGRQTGTAWFDDVKVQAGSRLAVYRRDYEGGVALVNASDAAVNIPLGGTFKKIRGVQDPAVNTGAYVSSVTIPSRDGLVLLRPPTLTVTGDGPMTAGVPKTLAGTLTTAPDDPLPGRLLTLESSTDQITWRALATGTTDGTGSYSFTVDPARDTYYRVRFAGDAEQLQIASRTAVVDCPDGVPLVALGGLRLSGASRYVTAVASAQKAFSADSSRYVVLATGEDYADALAASALAGAYDAPLLLTRRASLPAEVAAEIRRIARPGSTAIIVGGTGAISGTVAAAVKTGDITSVRRIAGSNRYDTAARIALEVKAAGGATDGVVYIATGTNFPDALAASPIAYAKKRPILLAPPTTLPAATASAIGALKPSSAYILGGASALSDAVLRLVRSRVPSVSRLSGRDRYETATKVANHSLAQGLSPARLAFAIGGNFPDALAGGPMIGRIGGVMFLTKTTSLEPYTRSALRSRKGAVGSVFFLGGTGVMTDGVRREVSQLLGL